MDKNFFEWIKVNIGSCLSWAITFGWLIFIYFKIHNGALPKDLNEFGDFIAGAFAPLAFFWLVRGFYQQGEGLKQNSEALRMQADELNSTTKALNDQVIEQRKLLQATNDEINILRDKNEYEKMVQHKKSQPFFHVSTVLGEFLIVTSDNSNSNHLLKLNFQLQNSRAICRELSIIIKTHSGRKHFIETLPLITDEENKKHDFNFFLVFNNCSKEEILSELTLELFYLDSLDIGNTVYFNLCPKCSNYQDNEKIEFYPQMLL